MQEDMLDRWIRQLQMNTRTNTKTNIHLEALSVDNGRSRLVVFLLADPHLLEGGERSEDGTSDPDGVFTLGWCDDFNLHCGWCKCCDFFLHAVSNAWEHGGTTGEHSISIKIFTDIDITLHDAVV